MLNFILLCALPAAFGFNVVVGRGMIGLYAPGQLTVVRWLLAGLVILAVALARGNRERWEPGPAGWGKILALGAVGMGWCSYCAYAGAQITAATNVALFYACTAAIVVSWECLTRQSRATPALAAGVATAILGAAVIITRGQLWRIGSIELNRGDLWGMAGMLGWAAYTIALRHVRHGLTPFALFAVTAIVGALTLLPVAIMETSAAGAPRLTATAALWITALVFVASIGSYMLYGFGLTRAGPILTSAALTLNPLYSALFATLLVGERLDWYHAAGGAMVLAGLGLINWDRARRAT